MRSYFFLSLIPLIGYLLLKFRKSFHMLQQNWYNAGNRYLKWVFRNAKKNFVTFELLFIVVVILSFFIEPIISMVLFGITYFITAFIYYHNTKKEQTKKPLVFTARVKRLAITLFLLYIFLFCIIGFIYQENNIPYYYLTIGIVTYLVYFMSELANIINQPIEKLVYYHYRSQAKKRLKKMNTMKVIGITGSYGKTSSKNILNDILNSKFNAFPSPQNFNTAYGLINTVNNYLDKYNDYLIAEMGAVKEGEIKIICDIVKPTYGILTTIGTAHLESYGSREAIQRTKFELIESLPKDGLGVLNGDDPKQVEYKLKNTCPIKWIGIDNHDVDLYAENIELSYKGTSFDCIFKNDKKKYHFETKLLGKANIYNILASILLGYELGISIEQLQTAVRQVKLIEHRLELKKYKDITIIDDAYNSNPVGSKMAVEVLGMMPGKKIIVTPGMIELGSEQYESNRLFGTYIADNADEVILVGENQTKPIYDGLIESKFKKENIHVINDVKLAFPLMEKLQGKETYVLLENDLPDVFNE